MTQQQLTPVGDDLTRLQTIERVQQQLADLGDVSDITRAIMMARGMVILRIQFAGAVLDGVCALAGTPLGFLTDRDNEKTKYPKEVIRDCAIEAILRGARLTGNEFNIIAGKCYLTKQFFARQLAGLVDNLRVTEGVPHRGDGGALVPMVADWDYQGTHHQMVCVNSKGADNRIPVKTDKYTGIDAILGTAHRKLYARIYRQVTGSTWVADEEPDQATTPALEAGDDLLDKQGDAIENILRTAGQCLPTCDELGAVDALEEGTVEALDANGASDETVERWRGACFRRRQEIKAGRGERSNGS